MVEATDCLFMVVKAVFVLVVVDDADVGVGVGDDDGGVEEVQIGLWDDNEFFMVLVVDIILDVVVDSGVEW